MRKNTPSYKHVSPGYCLSEWLETWVLFIGKFFLIGGKEVKMPLRMEAALYST